jgi:AcrR family transcriptional regulator
MNVVHELDGSSHMNSVQDKNEQRSSERTALRHQDLHGRLLAAAEATIVSRGLGSLKARTLAEAVGCSVGAIYGVFTDLDALILAVNGLTLDAIATSLAAVPTQGGPAKHLVRLAEAYLGYAAANGPRWRALFQHRMPEGRPLMPGYAERQRAAFLFIEAPLAALRPDLSAAKRTVLARTLFSAVHGMVDLGLDEKVASLTLEELRAQVRLVVSALASGLSSAELR